MNSRVKTGLGFLLGVILSVLFSLSTHIAAANQVYSVKELGINLSIPDNYIVITLDTSSNSEIFNAIGKTKEEIVELYRSSNIFLNAISKTENEDFVVTATTSTISDFNNLSEDALKSVADTLTSQYTNNGINVIKNDIYLQGQVKFIRVLFSDSANSVYVLQYYTNYNNKAINLTLRSYSRSISAEKEALFKTIVDSLKIGTTYSGKDQQQNSTLKYSDKDTATSSIVTDDYQKRYEEAGNSVTTFFKVVFYVALAIGILYVILKIIIVYQKDSLYRDYNQVINVIDNMNGHEFEKWCADLLRYNGFSNITLTPSSGDQGVDIIAYSNGLKYAIQCKRYSKNLGNKPIQEVNTGRTIYGCNKAAVMTNSGFTKGATEAANAVGVELWGRGVLARMLKQKNDILRQRAKNTQK